MNSSMAYGSKPLSLGAYYFRMYQMVSEQERLICQKEALRARQLKLQYQVDSLEKEIQQFELKLARQRGKLKKRNFLSRWNGLSEGKK